MLNRRRFIRQTALGGTALTLPLSYGHLPGQPIPSPMKELKLSLAQWSLHRALEKGEVRAADFPAIARNSYGISAVEYVNQFYIQEAANEDFWIRLKTTADNEGVKSLLIMVDNEGFLGSTDQSERAKAVENHKKWIRAAHILGCHSIRVNAFGNGTREALKGSLADALGRLASLGEKEGIHILIENHGLHTSDAEFVVGILEEVNNPYLGTLPDFGNWCLDTEWGSTQGGRCRNTFDPYKGVALFLPYAKGVSAKSYRFDAAGNETQLNYPKLLKLIKESDFNGYIGIEFEGESISEPEGIKATKTLLEKVWGQLD